MIEVFVHGKIEEISTIITFCSQIINLFKKTLGQLFNKDDYLRKDEIQKARKKLEKLELLKANLQDDFLDHVIASMDINEIKGRVEKDIILAKEKLTELQKEKSQFRKYIQRKFRCWRASWNITGSQMVPPKRKSMVASLPGNAFSLKKKLQKKFSYLGSLFRKAIIVSLNNAGCSIGIR